VDEAQRGWEEEGGGSVGGRDPYGVPGVGGKLGLAGDGDGWGPDDRAVDAPVVVFRRGGLSSRPPSIVADRGRRWLERCG